MDLVKKAFDRIIRQTADYSINDRVLVENAIKFNQKSKESFTSIHKAIAAFYNEEISYDTCLNIINEILKELDWRIIDENNKTN